MQHQPIKRHKALQNLSREHHDILVFALRLQKAVAKNANLNDMQAYSNWFWDAYLKAHLQLEEYQLFPLLDAQNHLVYKAKQEHIELKALFNQPAKTNLEFKQLYQLLQQHIRFEERKLFNFIQDSIDEHDLLAFKKQHQKQQTCGVWKNKFWE